MRVRNDALLAVGMMVVQLAGCGDDPHVEADAAALDALSVGEDTGRIEPIDAAQPPLDVPVLPDPDAFAPAGEELSLAYGPERLTVGQEQTMCIVLDAGNDVARFVRAIRTTLPQGSHHMIVYRTSEGLNATPRSCIPFASGGDAIFIAETREAELVFPPDVGLRFEPHQHIRLEVHAVNYYDAPIDVTASVRFELYGTDTPPTDEMRLLFTGDMSLSLPPRVATTVHSFHRPPEGARIFAITSHTHSLGTYASIAEASSRSDEGGTVLHESRSWSEPPLDVFSPPRVLAAGRGLRLTCTFFNSRDDHVGFGLGFEDEMCFLWAYYY